MSLYFDVPLASWPPPNPVLPHGSTYWIIYARISADPDNNKEGVRRQTILSERKIRETGWEGPVVLRLDNDKSAMKFRPAFQQMLTEDLPSGTMLGVAAYHIDRLYRRLEDLTELCNAYEKHQCEIISVTSADLDLSNATGRMVARLLAAVANHEVERVRERLLAYHKQAATDGKMNGKPGFGFRRDPQTGGIIFNEPEAAMVRRMAEQVLRSEPLSTIARNLNAEGWLTADAGRLRKHRRGEEDSEGVRRRAVSGQWTPANLKKFLLRPRLIGARTHRGVVVNDAAWPAILDLTVFRQVTALLTDPVRSKYNPSAKRVYLCTGVLFCGRCLAERGVWVTLSGRNKFAPKGGGKVGRIYICLTERGGCNRLSRDADKVDAIVEARLVHRLLERPSHVDTGAAEKVTALQGKIVEIDVLLEEYNEDRINGDITREEFKKSTEKLRERRKATEQEIALIDRQTTAATISGKEKVADWVDKTIAEKHSLLLREADRIVLLPAARRGGPFDPALIEIKWLDRAGAAPSPNAASVPAPTA